MLPTLFTRQGQVVRCLSIKHVFNESCVLLATRDQTQESTARKPCTWLTPQCMRGRDSLQHGLQAVRTYLFSGTYKSWWYSHRVGHQPKNLAHNMDAACTQQTIKQRLQEPGLPSTLNHTAHQHQFQEAYARWRSWTCSWGNSTVDIHTKAEAGSDIANAQQLDVYMPSQQPQCHLPAPRLGNFPLCVRTFPFKCINRDLWAFQSPSR